MSSRCIYHIYAHIASPGLCGHNPHHHHPHHNLLIIDHVYNVLVIIHIYTWMRIIRNNLNSSEWHKVVTLSTIVVELTCHQHFIINKRKHNIVRDSFYDMKSTPNKVQTRLKKLSIKLKDMSISNLTRIELYWRGVRLCFVFVGFMPKEGNG